MRTSVPSTRQFRAPWVIRSANAEAAFVPRLYPIGGNPPVSRIPAHFAQTPLLHPQVIGERMTISSSFLSLRRSERTDFVRTVPAGYFPALCARTAPRLSSSSRGIGTPLAPPQSSVTTTWLFADWLRSLPNAPPWAVAIFELLETSPLARTNIWSSDSTSISTVGRFPIKVFE